MEPTTFKEVNKTFGKPNGLTDEQCSSLPVFQGFNILPGEDNPRIPVIVSAWLPNEAEKAAIAAGQPINLAVYAIQPAPVCLFVGFSLESGEFEQFPKHIAVAHGVTLPEQDEENPGPTNYDYITGNVGKNKM